MASMPKRQKKTSSNHTSPTMEELLGSVSTTPAASTSAVNKSQLLQSMVRNSSL